MAPTVLITGASQGIGKATALLFARQGYDLALAARQQDRLAAVAQQIQAQGREALAVPTDICDPEQVNVLVQKALAAYGHIDVLVNNAGICMTGPMENTTLDDWQQIMDINFWGCLYTIQALLPQFLERGAGTIVNVGSIGGKMPLPQMTAYCASKYALTGLTETLRLELVPKGIQVCAVHPSVTKSDFLERAQFRGKDAQEAESRRQQMNQVLDSAVASKPEDVAQAIWDIVNNPQAEIVVGAAAIATTAHRLAPGLSQWIFERTVKS